MDDTTTGGNTTVEARPTFEQAFAADASPAPDTTVQTTTPSAAVQPTAAQAPPQQTEDRSPFIPRARFDEVNARAKAAEEWKQKYAYAERVPQEQFDQMTQWFNRAHTDKLAFAQDLIAELQADPEVGPQLKSLAARALGHRQPQAPAAPAAEYPVIQLEDGRSVDLNALKAQWTEQMRAEYAPAVQTAQELKQEREAVAAQASADKFATGLMGELTQLAGFNEHKTAIATEVQRIIAQYPKGDPRTNSPEFLEAAAFRAYHKVALPHLGAKAQSQMLDSMQRTAAASTGVNPGSAAPTTPRRAKSFDDKSLQW